MIHPLAIVEDGCSIGENVTIDAFTIVRAGTEIGSNCVIESHCEIGHPSNRATNQSLKIGADSLIRSHSVIYVGSSFGPRLQTGHRVTVRENSKIGVNLQIGTLSDIQGDCVIGNYARLHSNVHVGQGSLVKDFVWIFPYVVLTNDPHPPSDVLKGVIIENYAVVATMSTILPGVKVGVGSLVGAHSLVTRDVPDETIVAGVPAKNIGPISKIKHSFNSEISPYPWRFNFTRGYPDEVIQGWKSENQIVGDFL